MIHRVPVEDMNIVNFPLTKYVTFPPRANCHKRHQTRDDRFPFTPIGPAALRFTVYYTVFSRRGTFTARKIVGIGSRPAEQMQSELDNRPET